MATFRANRARKHGSGGYRRAGLSLIVALLVGACGPSPEAMVDSAKSYLAKNDLNAASIQLKNALQERSDLAEARFLLGKVNLEQGNLPGAVKELQRAAELGFADEQVAPFLARALVMSGEFDRVLKDYDGKKLNDTAAQVVLTTAVATAHFGKADLPAARAAYEQALQLSPEDVQARIGLGRAKLFSGDAPAAQADAEAVLAKQPKAAEAQGLLADALLAQNRPDDAAKALEAAIQATSDNVGYHFALVSLLLRQNQEEQAIAKLEEMKKVAPAHALTRYLQAFIDFRKNRINEARDGVMLALKDTPDSLPANLLAGAIFVRLNEHEQARAHLNKVLERAPSQVLARRLLVASYLAAGQPDRALEGLQPLMGIRNPDPTLLSLAGQVYMANGDAEKAEELYSRAAAAQPDSAQARTRLAMARMAAGDSERAFADLEAASDLDQNSGQADVALIVSHLVRREFDKALAAQAQLEKKQPNNPQTHNLKGGILMGLKDLPKARLAFEKALELKPDFLPAANNLARLDMADKRPDMAKARFETLLQHNPKHANALIAYSELQVALGEPAATVLATLERAIAVDQTAVPPQLALIRHHLRQRDGAKALALAQKLAGTQSGNPAVVEALGRSQLLAGEQQQALATFNKLASMQPQATAPLLLLADVQRAAKETTQAEQSLRKALEIQPNLVDAQQRLAGLLIQRGASGEALSVAKSVQKQRPDAAVGYALEGDAQFAASKWPEAANAYRAALNRQRTGDVVLKLHAAMMRGGKRQEADKLVADWLKDEPRDMAVRGYIAELALAEKRLPEALHHFQVMHEVAPRNALVLNNLAWTASQLKDAQALKYAEQALELAPDNATVLDTAGVIQMDNGQTEKGLANLVRAVSLAPDVAALRINLAKAYVKVGRKDDARKELDILKPKLKDGTPQQREAAELLKSL
ncbi:hypothetical protein CJ010_19645 [Azoarcus sp. DD4]|uniref:XrtA/PEP-CTERM system TPR-repeat protein PrsT n=1 Tax=Azoarcus sp. DD4 TaxID=2027405 RepID=UPI0011263859|nr:XrtA/PEP-CTERM system TPR-repeat protein PrsT [Azoarcus sp. DD4]QDF98593.1 hypothetical protein CJ010_19645 [Azoarcus sp. DD4]